MASLVRPASTADPDAHAACEMPLGVAVVALGAAVADGFGVAVGSAWASAWASGSVRGAVPGWGPGPRG